MNSTILFIILTILCVGLFIFIENNLLSINGSFVMYGLGTLGIIFIFFMSTMVNNTINKNPSDTNVQNFQLKQTVLIKDDISLAKKIDDNGNTIYIVKGIDENDLEISVEVPFHLVEFIQSDEEKIEIYNAVAKYRYLILTKKIDVVYYKIYITDKVLK